MIIRKFFETMDIPLDIINGFYLEMYSQNELMLTGKVDVIDLDSDKLKIKCAEHIMGISGKNLNILSYNANGIRIRGKIEKFEFI